MAGEMFTRGAFGLADPADTSPTSAFVRKDFIHMNVSFGVLALRNLADRLHG